MKLYKLLTPKETLFTENEFIAEFSQKKFPETARLPGTLK